MMKDMVGNELHSGDLVAFTRDRGSARMSLAVVTNPEKRAIFSMYTYEILGELQKVYSTRPGNGVSSWKLLQIDAANHTILRDIHAELKEKAKDWL